MEQKVEAIISQNLIDLRKSRNLKQSELSLEIGYSDKTISRWENGTSVPDIGTLVKIAEFYNITVMDLISENAVHKTTEEEQNRNQEKLIKDISTLTLSGFTVWLIAVIFYLGVFIIKEVYFWQCFIWAIPVSCFFFYRLVKNDYNITWLRFLLLSLIMCGTITALYLTLLSYNFWQLFLLLLPLECIGGINIFFKKAPPKKNKE